jgi:chromosome segregation ATPase
VKDGNRIAGLRAEVDQLRDLAARAEEAERAVFEAETRAEGAVRRAELMESELMSTRAEVDRLRARIVELEASLRRALAEVGEATSRRDVRATDQAAGEGPAERSLELADQLRMKVVDLESSLRSVMSDMSEGDTTAAIVERTTQEDLAAEIERAAEMAGASATAAAEVRLAELEERLSALDERIAYLGGSFEDTAQDAEPEGMLEADPDAVVEIDVADEDEQEDDLFVDLSNQGDPEVIEEVSPEQIKPPASRWSDWRTT